MTQLVPKDDLVINGLQFVDAAAFQIPDRFGQECVGDEVLGLGQPHVLHIFLGKLLAVQIQVIAHTWRLVLLLLIAMLLLLLGDSCCRLAVALVDKFLVAGHFCSIYGNLFLESFLSQISDSLRL